MFKVITNLYRFLYCVVIYMYCRWRSSYQEGRVGISLIVLILPHCCVCPKARPGFPTSYVMIWVMMRGDCSKRIDIGGIVDHHCLNFLFIYFCITLHKSMVHVKMFLKWSYVTFFLIYDLQSAITSTAPIVVSGYLSTLSNQ